VNLNIKKNIQIFGEFDLLYWIQQTNYKQNPKQAARRAELRDRKYLDFFNRECVARERTRTTIEPDLLRGQPQNKINL